MSVEYMPIGCLIYLWPVWIINSILYLSGSPPSRVWENGGQTEFMRNLPVNNSIVENCRLSMLMVHVQSVATSISGISTKYSGRTLHLANHKKLSFVFFAVDALWNGTICSHHHYIGWFDWTTYIQTVLHHSSSNCRKMPVQWLRFLR